MTYLRHFQFLQLFTSAELGWISNQESVIPRDVDAFFRIKLGGYDYKLFDVSINNLFGK